MFDYSDYDSESLNFYPHVKLCRFSSHPAFNVILYVMRTALVLREKGMEHNHPVAITPEVISRIMMKDFG